MRHLVYSYAVCLSACMGPFQEMRASDVPRDVITWNTIISACKETGDWQRATALLAEMQVRPPHSFHGPPREDDRSSSHWVPSCR